MTKKNPTQSQSSASVIAIVGNDSFLRSNALARVLESVRSDMGDLGPMRFEGDRATPAEVLDEVRTLSLLGGIRVAIVDDADDFISANRELMERYCSAPASGSLLILLCNSLPRNTRLYKIIEGHGQIVVCEAPKGPAFGTWITQRASATYGKKIAASAVQSLRWLLGDSPGWIDAELGKLAAYVGARPEITVSDVNELTDQRREEKVFGIMDAMAGGDAASALFLWDQVLSTDRAAPGRALAGLALKVRQMVEARDELDATGQVFASSKRMFMDAGELRRRLERISKRQLLEQQRDLLRADLAIKTGLSSLSLAIEQFIVKHTVEPAPKVRDARRAS
jgi:DNA polymerase-3 subunit delta